MRRPCPCPCPCPCPRRGPARPTARGMARLAPGRTACPGGSTTGRGRARRPPCRTSPTRCRSAARRPPLTCSRRGGTSRAPARGPGPRMPDLGQARRPPPSRARRSPAAGPTSHPRRTRRGGRRPIRARVPCPSPAAVPRRIRVPTPRHIRTSRCRSLAGPCTTRPAHPAAGPRPGLALRPGRPGPPTPMTPAGFVGGRVRPPPRPGSCPARPGRLPLHPADTAWGRTWPSRREQRPPGASAPGQAGQPGAPASRQPAAAPDHGGQRRPVQRVDRSESGGDPADHVGPPAWLAGGSLAADGRPGIRRASAYAISR